MARSRAMLRGLVVVFVLQGATCLPISRAWDSVSDEMKVAMHNLQRDLQKAASTFLSHVRRVPVISGQGEPRWFDKLAEFFVSSFLVHVEKQARALQDQVESLMDQLEGTAIELFVVAQGLRSFATTGVKVDHLKNLVNGVLTVKEGGKPA